MKLQSISNFDWVEDFMKRKASSVPFRSHLASLALGALAECPYSFLPFWLNKCLESKLYNVVTQRGRWRQKQYSSNQKFIIYHNFSQVFEQAFI